MLLLMIIFPTESFGCICAITSILVKFYYIGNGIMFRLLFSVATCICTCRYVLYYIIPDAYNAYGLEVFCILDL